MAKDKPEPRQFERRQWMLQVTALDLKLI